MQKHSSAPSAYWFPDMAVLIDVDQPVPTMRQSLYEGELLVLTRLPAVADLVDYTRDQLTELFKPYDPELAHEHFDKAAIAKLLSEWKPLFIHSEQAKRLVRRVILQAGFSPHDTHYDLPKPRTSFPLDHLTAGIAYAFPWHRDVWYSAPSQQINWWLPVYTPRKDNAMGFDPESFSREVVNDSAAFDYYRNNRDRSRTGAQLTREVQARPAALDHEARGELVLLPAPGEILLFSGAHLHRSIPNTSGNSRYSVDFRTVDVTDLRAGRGAPLVDVHCTGTAIRDFLNVADGAKFDEEFVTQCFGAPPPNSMLVFVEEGASQG